MMNIMKAPKVYLALDIKISVYCAIHLTWTEQI